MNPQKLSKLLTEHLQFGGVTLSPEGKVVTEGIAVACNPQTEHTFQYTDAFRAKLEIMKWVWSLKEHTHLGLWIDDTDKVYLDQIEVYHQTQIAKAILKALEKDQLAVQLLNPNITLWITSPHGL